jgi:hypothetical protein
MRPYRENFVITCTKSDENLKKKNFRSEMKHCKLYCWSKRFLLWYGLNDFQNYCLIQEIWALMHPEWFSKSFAEPRNWVFDAPWVTFKIYARPKRFLWRYHMREPAIECMIHEILATQPCCASHPRWHHNFWHHNSAFGTGPDQQAQILKVNICVRMVFTPKWRIWRHVWHTITLWGHWEKKTDGSEIWICEFQKWMQCLCYTFFLMHWTISPSDGLVTQVKMDNWVGSASGERTWRDVYREYRMSNSSLAIFTNILSTSKVWQLWSYCFILVWKARRRNPHLTKISSWLYSAFMF